MQERDIVRKSGYLLSLLTIVLFGFCNILQSRAEKKFIESAECPKYFVSSIEEKGAPPWTHQDDNCYICNIENTKKSWLITKFLPTNNAELVLVDITVSFRECAECKNQLLKVYALQEEIPKKMNEVKLKRKLDSLPLLKGIKNDTNATRVRHRVQFVSNSSGVLIVFLTESACVVVYNIEVTSFFCEYASIDGVYLPSTVSPAYGNRTVNSSCYSNTVPSSEQAFGLCGSDGKWKFVTPCYCREGFTFGNKGCRSCPINTYKDHIGNNPCSPCPSKSKSAGQAVRCSECEEGYHRFPGDNYTDICHGIPSGVEQLKFSRKSETSVLIHWSLPSRTINEVFYDIQCFTCRRDICKVPCGGKIFFKPSNSKLTQLNVTVVNLEPDTQYKFVVRSKNNNMINESLWPSVGGKFKTEALYWSSGLSKAVTIGIPVVVVILVIIIIILVIILMRRRKLRRRETMVLKKGVDLPLIGEKNYIDPTTYDDPERAVSEFAKELNRDMIKFESILGGGEFGDVYKGTLKRPGQPVAKVAIKTLKPGSTQKNRKDFLIEASVMGQFKNLNVITLEGVVTKDIPLLIVTEFMENGSLDGYLKSNDGLLKPLQLLGIARGVSSGMAYLAGMHFVHRDLAARNVLVNVNLACKVADFGLSRDIGDSKDSEYETQGGRIPVRWTAPEAIRYRKFSTASDVWSYGILLWEIMSFAERPYWDWGNLEVLERVDGGYRLPPPMNCHKIVHQLMMECWESDRVKRPAFPDIVKIIEEWIRSPEKLKEENIKIRKSEVLDIATFSSVKEWLDAFKMGMYASNFARAGYRNLDDIVQLSEGELLAKVGVRLVGHRHKIYQRIKEMNEHMKLAREQSVRI